MDACKAYTVLSPLSKHELVFTTLFHATPNSFTAKTRKFTQQNDRHTFDQQHHLRAGRRARLVLGFVARARDGGHNEVVLCAECEIVVVSKEASILADHELVEGVWVRIVRLTADDGLPLPLPWPCICGAATSRPRAPSMGAWTGIRRSPPPGACCFTPAISMTSAPRATVAPPAHAAQLAHRKQATAGRPAMGESVRAQLVLVAGPGGTTAAARRLVVWRGCRVPETHG